LYSEGACGEQRALLEVQLRGGFVEEDPRCGLHADRGLPAERAVGDAVEIARENLRLGVGFVVFERELGLGDLLAERALVAAEIDVAHQLHRDRGATLQRLSVGDVLDGGAEDAGGVDAVVFVVALVLDRDRRVLEIAGDVVPADRRAQGVGLDVAQARAVGGEHLRGGAGEDRVQLRDRRRGLGDVQHIRDRSPDRQCDRGGGGAEPDEHDAREAAAAVATAALACLSRHRPEEFLGAARSAIWLSGRADAGRRSEEYRPPL
jgi:hypothetical protein